ncbi:MAG: citrate (Si)-synthase, partial [Bacteroidetes bacterium]|nr:citrate (Si)-synthase [Bacteroidota bacterium]
MSDLKKKLHGKIENWRPRTTKLIKEYGDVVVGDVTIAKLIGGMRGIKCLVTDISYLDPIEGIRFRGFTIPEVLEKLPKPKDGSEIPFVEGFVYLLLTGDLPTENEVNEVAEEFKQRRVVPKYVFDVIDAHPEGTHPMVLFSAAVLSMEKESEFVKGYQKGISKMDYWDPTYEDAMNLLAKLPEIGAYIYRKKYRNADIIAPNPDMDFGANFAHMMGIDKPYDDMSRLYFILHSDHESGNVSAHT